MKRRIRLTEGDLHRIVANSVKRILRESDAEDYEIGMLKGEDAEHYGQMVGPRFGDKIVKSLQMAFRCINNEMKRERYIATGYMEPIETAKRGLYDALNCVEYDDSGNPYCGRFTLRAASGLKRAKRALEWLKREMPKRHMPYEDDIQAVNLAYENVLIAEKYIDEAEFNNAEYN